MNKDELIQSKILSTFHLSKEPSINIKLSKKIIDLKKWILGPQLYKFIFDHQQKYIEIKALSSNQQIINLITKFQNYSDFLDFVTQNNIKINTQTIKLIKDNWSEKENISNILLNANNNPLDVFGDIYKEARSKYKENAVWTLYLGAYFLIGKTENSFAAPLINIPIKIKKTDNNTIVLQKILETNFKFTINEKLNYFLNKEFKINIPNSIPHDENYFNRYLYWLKDIVAEKNFNFSSFVPAIFNPEKNINIQASAILGLYDPTGGVVMRDYQKIANSNVDPFKTLDIISEANKYRDEILKTDDIIEINRPLNIYQKYAVASCLKTCTLIYGPPGTGKSEVIANLIANIVNNGNNVLVCSEKSAALKVIEKRLGKLSILSLSGYELNQKEKFFNKIIQIHNYLRIKPVWHELIKTTNQYNQILNFLKVSKTALALAVNYGGIERIEKLILNQNLEKFNELRKNAFFDKLINLAIQNNKTTLEEKFNWLIKLQNFYNENLFLFAKLSNNDFNSFTRNDINKFLCKYEKKKKDKLLQKFLKFRRLSDLFKDGENISSERNKWETFIETLRELNIVKLDWNDITLLKQFEYNDAQSFKDDWDLKEFLDKYEKSDYKQFELLNSLLINYDKEKSNLASSNAEKIVDNYLSTFIEKLKKTDPEQREKYIEMFSKAHLRIRPEINKFIREYFNCLKNIFPIWCLSPIQTCSTTECESDIFDYGIFDEASQMFLENAIPLVYRCHLNTVAGDDKQLQPTTFFLSRDFDDDPYDDDDEDIIEGQINSLFEQANSALWNKYYLKNHYRSDNANLIDFSNKYLYDNKLQTATKNGCFDTGLEVHTVQGIYDNKTNPYEAKCIIEHLIDNYSKKDIYEKKNVLIITFNIAQKELIEKMFIALTNEKIWLRDAYQNDLIAIKNLENVQGDEADIVYLSICFAKNNDGLMRQSFGPLSVFGGENRLNVAITRAKSNMYVFKSIRGKDITNLSNPHTRIFREFITYCDAIENSVKSYEYMPTQSKNNDDETSIQTQIYNFLTSINNNDNHCLILDYPVSEIKIPIALYDIKKKKVKLAILIDNEYSKESLKALEKYDLCKFLKDRAYPVYIVNQLDWILKQNLIKEKLLKFMEKINEI